MAQSRALIREEVLDLFEYLCAHIYDYILLSIILCDSVGATAFGVTTHRTCA